MNRRWRSLITAILVVLALLVAAGLGAPPAHASGTGSIAGRVTFGTTPVAGVQVWMYTVPSAQWVGAATTAGDGSYLLPNVGPGTYRLLAWSPAGAYPSGWYPQALTYATGGNLDVGVGTALAGRDVNLANTAGITGQATNNGLGIGGISIWLLAETGELRAAVLTDPDGRFTMANLAPGRYRLNFYDPLMRYPAGSYWRDRADFLEANVIELQPGAIFVADQPLYTVGEQPVPPYSIGPGGPYSGVIGDSITQQSTHAIHLALDSIASTTVVGINRQRVDDLQPVATKMAALTPPPAQVIIAAGTNDAIQGRPLATTQSALLTMIDSLPTAVCITVVNVSASTFSAGLNAWALVWNDWLRGLSQIRPKAQVIDWARVRGAYIDAGEPQGAWTTDGVHLTSLGQQAYASLMRESVLSCGAPPASIRGTSYIDHNLNGIKDPGDDALAGQPITVKGSDRLGNAVSRSVLTGIDGSWAVTGLSATTYSVAAQSMPPLGSPYSLVGTAGGVASGSGVTSIVLAAGASATGYDFPSPPTVSTVSGTVYADLNGNRVRDPAEPGLDRVTVRLTGIDWRGSAVSLTTSTPPDGSWTFTLNPGTYTLTELAPNGYDAGTVTAGGFGGVPGVRTITGVTVPVTSTATGYTFGDIPLPVGSWAIAASSPSSAVGRSVAVAGDGTIAVAGAYTSSITLGSGATAVTLSSAPGLRSGYLATYDAAGSLRWATNLSATGSSETFKVAIDGSGNVIVAGDLSGSVVLGSPPNQVTLTGPPGLAAYVASFNPNGSLRWARTLDDSVTSVATGVAADATGAVWLTGAFRTSVVIGRVNGVGGTTLAGSGSIDGFIAKYQTDGAFLGARSLNSTTGLIPLDIAANPSGGATVVGMHVGYNFGPGFVAGTAGQIDAFAVSVDPGGNVMWARSIGGPGSDMAVGVAVDAATGMVVVSGGFAGTVDMGNGQVLVAPTNGPSDGFVLAIDSVGSTLWARAGGGEGPDRAARVSIGSGHVRVAGWYTGPASFGPANLSSYGGTDGFVASYDLLGNLEWVRVVAGAGDDEVAGVATAVGGDALVVGSFSGPAAIMPGPVGLPLPGTEPGVFVARLRG